MSKMKKFFLSLAVLIIASVHIVWAQKVLIYKSDGTTIEYEVSTLDSMVFVKEKQTMPSHLTCPDDHHPHAIDLGLPSGTKWCCCNVGASKPEEYGGYYAWGETKEKGFYNWETYAYGTWDKCVNIGSDIAGTDYDAATANMGAPWRMPSTAQLQELINNSSSQWQWQNSVDGILVTGPNGGHIFLPAAGVRWPDDDLYSVGYGGSYWASSLYPNNSNYADYMVFYLSNWFLDHFYRFCGHSVRAVCP